MPSPVARSSMMQRVSGFSGSLKKTDETCSPNKFEAVKSNSFTEPTSPNLSMRRRASSLIQSLPPSPRCVKTPFSAETSIDSLRVHSSIVEQSYRSASQASHRGIFSCDRILADMETNLNNAQRKLEEEKLRNELLVEKIQHLKESYEQTKRQKDETVERLSQLASAVRRLSDAETSPFSADSSFASNCERSYDSSFETALEEAEEDLPIECERSDLTEDDRIETESVISMSESGSLNTAYASTVTVTPTKQQPEEDIEETFAPRQQLMLKENLLPRRSLHGSSTASLSSMMKGIKRKSLDHNTKACKSPRNSTQPSNPVPIAAPCEGISGHKTTAEARRYPLRPIQKEERFSYVDGYDEKCASAPRPVSVAQANRHSAVIGDQLFSLQIIPPLLEDENNHSSRTSLEPLTPESAEMFHEHQAYASSNRSGIGTHTSAPPSEDNPMISCRVNRTFENPLGGGYVKRKFEKKMILGRTSVSAYRSQQQVG